MASSCPPMRDIGAVCAVHRTAQYHGPERAMPPDASRFAAVGLQDGVQPGIQRASSQTPWPYGGHPSSFLTPCEHGATEIPLIIYY